MGRPPDLRDFSEWIDQAAPWLREKLHESWLWLQAELYEMSENDRRDREMTNPTDPRFGGEHLMDVARAAAENVDDTVDVAGDGILDNAFEVIEEILNWLF